MPCDKRIARSLLVASLSGCLVILAAFPAGAIGSTRGRGGPAAPDTPIGRKQLPALTPSPPDALTRALEVGRITAARYALERATSLFHLGAVRSRFGEVKKADPRAATLILRDLALRVRQLGVADRRRATQILARPTDGSGNPFGADYSVPEATPVCSADACVHYVPTTGDAPPSADTSPMDGIPDWVATTSAVVDEVWAFEVDGYGYRAPKSDDSSPNDGGNAKLDMYLAELGSVGLFGYCTTDDPNAFNSYQFFDFSAYCVLDDDYVGFGYADPTDPLKVTAAHEFFHAVQFAYDAADDAFLHEGTAAWMEDEVYDDINDNRSYLGTSPLAQPWIPLDRSTGFRVYGSWIFWRFLSEYVGANDGGGAAPDPTIIRAIWERSDGSAGGPDDFSVQAAARAIANRTLAGSPGRFRWAFADFAVWNARPGAFYDEGGAYPAADIAASRLLRGSRRSTSVSARLDHLSNRYVAIRRGSGLSSTAKLKVTLNGPAYNNGTEASLVVIRRSGAILLKSMPIASDGDGDGAATVRFGSTVSRVIVIVTNASTRYRNCFLVGPPYACLGDPIDDNRTFTFRASVR